MRCVEKQPQKKGFFPKLQYLNRVAVNPQIL